MAEAMYGQYIPLYELPTKELLVPLFVKEERFRFTRDVDLVSL